jgi:hypothetical protein
MSTKSEIFFNKDEVIRLIKKNNLKFKCGKLNSPITDKNSDIFKINPVHNYSMPYKGSIGERDIVGLADYKEQLIVQLYLEDPSSIDMFDYEERPQYYIVRSQHKFFIKEETPLVNDTTKNLHGLLIEWGYNTDKTIAGSKILKLSQKSNLDEFKKCPSVIYRGISLSSDAIERLQSNKIVRLKNLKFSSWSMDKEKAKKFAALASERDDDEYEGLVMKYSPKNEILINIELFEEKVFKSLDYWPWRGQKELILVNSPEMLILRPEQLVSKEKLFEIDVIGKNYEILYLR